MTAKPTALSIARKRRDTALARIAELEHQNRSFCMLLGAILERASKDGVNAVTFDITELEAIDPARLVLVEMFAQGKVVIGLKATGEEPLELDLAKRAKEELEQPPMESA